MSSKDVNDNSKKWDETRVEEQKRSTKKKITFLFAGVILIAGVLGVSLYLMLTNYRESILKEQTQQMVYLVQSVTNSIEVYVQEYVQDLQVAAGDNISDYEKEVSLGRTEDMERYVEKQVASRGKDLSMACYESADHTFTGSASMQDYELYREMSAPEDTVSISLVRAGERVFYLRLSAETPAGGRLHFFLDMKEMYEKTASYITLGENGYVMLKASDGIILSHPVEEQIGIDVIADRQREYPDFDLSELKVMVAEQLAGKTGTSIYDSYWWADNPPSRVKKISAYQPAYLGEDFLIVSAVIDYRELSIPISSGVMRILAVALPLVGLLLLLLGILFLAIRSARRFETENANLRKLNEQLEELRIQEEHMAHQQRLQLLGTMTGGIAHEFNNLLTPIMGYSAMLLADADPQSDQREDLQAIYDSAEKAKEIIDQLSQFSGKNAEKTFRRIPVAQVIDKAMLVVESVKPKNVTLNTLLEQKDTMIQGNPTQITQLLLNLCTNAFHAMKDQENGLLKVSGQYLKSNSIYRLTVCDNGCGMDSETLSQMYVPFFTTKKAGEGTGLGLSIVHRIVEAHGGLLRVKSQPGAGTEFEIDLPAEKNPE